MKVKRFSSLIAGLTVLVTSSSVVLAEDSVANKDPSYFPTLKVAIRSWDPEDVKATYRQHSSGSCSYGGTVGIGVGGTSGFNAEIQCLPTNERIAAAVSIEPSKANAGAKASKSEVDVSDMRPDFIEVTKTGDGRVYFLIIAPEMVKIQLPKAFTVDDLSPFDWDFPQSPVVLNDNIYVGRVGMGGGSLIGVTIAGVADLEFSLREIKNSKPIGTLQSGTLTIKYGDDQITISGVLNGADKKTLEGPYKIWVRSTDADVTGDEYRRQMTEQVKVIQEMKDKGDVTITDDIIKQFKSFVDDNRPMLIGSSSREVQDRDLVK
ncbi:hypothetical protein CA85_27920 [Allorhodopirellula solitaria]|uniref:Uncharacterized protein n=1 Tax=Allorhodopirellula solitaria TaxID=2527987 RepID=A0A5C5XXR6_9BACT|nr:hypothetical protein CA85_27920 [Allorhodopirellula solitaria]